MSDEPVLVAVAAMARNRVIGFEGHMPWTLPTDFKHFRELTTGRPMIMGRRTIQSIGRALPERDTIVLTRHSLELGIENLHIASHPEDALSVAAICAEARGTNEIVIAGGAEIYRLFLSRLHRIELTVVDAEPEGDTWFPAFEQEGFNRVSTQSPQQNPRDSASCRFETWVRS